MSYFLESSILCVVCGGEPSGSRYGPVACLRCIVFFRRALKDVKMRPCDKNCKLTKNKDIRFLCRSCRLRKCLDAGMNPKAIRVRDKTGPRKTRCRETKISANTDKLFDSLLLLQNRQRLLHKRRFRMEHKKVESVAFGVTMNSRLYRRASTHDINLVLNIGLRNAMEWSNQFETFKGCTLKEKKIVLSEFGIAFVLVDQAFKTAQKTNDKRFWLLQNDTFLHTDFFLCISKTDVQVKELRYHAQNHFDFINGLQNTIKDPLLKLHVDKFECVILKTLLLMTPSYAGRLKIDKSKKVVSECLSELMSYCMSHHPENGAVRFGEIILLLGSIRCAVKGFYNQTKQSSLFNSSKFDNFVKGYFLS